MTLGERGLWFWLWWSLLVAVAAVSVASVFYSRNGNGAVATAAGAAVGLGRRPRPTKATQLPLEHAADELAKQLRRQWGRAANERGLLPPAPIPLWWRSSRRQVTGPIEEAVRRRRFVPLPGMVATTAERLRLGTLKDLLSVYGGLGSGRLIILGEPGAGKSSAGIRLLCDALDHRASVADQDVRAQVPVPVLVTPQGWDLAAGEPFAEWLVDRLARDYALLRAPEYGRDAALQLVKGGHLAVILDGLDEIPEAQRSVALGTLDEQVDFRLVVLTRREELVAVAGGRHLWDAAALELEPIGPRQVADYLVKFLTSRQTDSIAAPWQGLIDHLREHPGGVLAQVLNTPLMLTLVLDAYGPEGKIDEFIDVEGHRFGGRKAVQDHLLNQVLTAAYTETPGGPAPPTLVSGHDNGWDG